MSDCTHGLELERLTHGALADRIEQASTARETSGRLLRDFTPFAWDRVCLFGGDATSQQVDAVLGFSWGRAGGDAGGWPDLLVFVEADPAVRAAQLPVGMLQARNPAASAAHRTRRSCAAEASPSGGLAQ